MYDDVIEVLQNLARDNQEKSKEIGQAIKIVKFCMKHGISAKDSVTRLPDTCEVFGYFTVQECNELGHPIETVSDADGIPIEINPEALIIE